MTKTGESSVNVQRLSHTLVHVSSVSKVITNAKAHSCIFFKRATKENDLQDGPLIVQLLISSHTHKNI